MNTWSKLFSKLNNKNTNSRRLLWDRRIQWECLTRHASDIFNEVIEESKTAGYYERLYISNSYRDVLWEGKRYKNFNSISLFMGNHPTDISLETFSEGKRTSRKIITEKGAAFTIAQLPNGGVAFSYYACNSELHNDREPKLFRVYKQPFDVNENDIKSAVRGVLNYAHYTSYSRFYPFHRYVLEYLKIHKREIGLMVIGAVVGALLSLFVTESFNAFYKNNNSGHYQTLQPNDAIHRNIIHFAPPIYINRSIVDPNCEVEIDVKSVNGSQLAMVGERRYKCEGSLSYLNFCNAIIGLDRRFH